MVEHGVWGRQLSSVLGSLAMRIYPHTHMRTRTYKQGEGAMGRTSTFKSRHWAQLFLILLLFMLAVFTRKSIWIYYVSATCNGVFVPCSVWRPDDDAAGQALLLRPGLACLKNKTRGNDHAPDGWGGG